MLLGRAVMTFHPFDLLMHQKHSWDYKGSVNNVKVVTWKHLNTLLIESLPQGCHQKKKKKSGNDVNTTFKKEIVQK